MEMRSLLLIKLKVLRQHFERMGICRGKLSVNLDSEVVADVDSVEEVVVVEEHRFGRSILYGCGWPGECNTVRYKCPAECMAAFASRDWPISPRSGPHPA